MRNLIKNVSIMLTSLSVLMVGAFVVVPPVAYADSKGEICKGVNLGGSTDCDGAGATTSVNGIVKTVINLLSYVVGIVSVIMIIIGGFKYIISSGDSGNVTSAKNTILYAIIGLVVVVFAQILVRFVLSSVNV